MSVECIKQEDGSVVCKFLSRLIDTKECLDIESNIMQSIEGAKNVIFDLSGVEYIDSSFLRICGKTYYKTKAGDFSIVNVSPTVRKIFKIAGLVDRLNLK